MCRPSRYRLSIDVIKVTDPLLTPFIADGTAVMLPVFRPIRTFINICTVLPQLILI